MEIEADMDAYFIFRYLPLASPVYEYLPRRTGWAAQRQAALRFWGNAKEGRQATRQLERAIKPHRFR